MLKPCLKAIVAISTIGLLCSGVSSAQQIQVSTNTIALDSKTVDFTQFTPRPQKKTKIDYDVWDSLLEEMVLYTGPSTRLHISRPAPVTGSRFSRGHTSRYRLEGNRIPYSKMKPAFKQAISDYRLDLERIGTQVDIAKLSRNEQLAYWLNLHNVVLIEQLSKAYPVRNPLSLKVGDPPVPLHDAKIININDTKLSLRDIRERIVYPNWSNPKVIYGFHLGDIGSPSIQTSAFLARNVSDLLSWSAGEFTNSLRGFYTRNDRQYISQLYTDVARFYFPDFDNDVSRHLKEFMRDDVKSQILSGVPFKTSRYETIIADLTAGQGSSQSISPLETTSRDSLSRVGGDSIRAYMNELIAKRQTLERLGLITYGTVTVEDVPRTEPVEPPTTAVE